MVPINTVIWTPVSLFLVTCFVLLPRDECSVVGSEHMVHPIGHVSSLGDSGGSWKAPRLQLLDLREEGFFFLPVPSPAEGGFVAVDCQDRTPLSLPSVTVD